MKGQSGCAKGFPNHDIFVSLCFVLFCSVLPCSVLFCLLLAGPSFPVDSVIERLMFFVFLFAMRETDLWFGWTTFSYLFLNLKNKDHMKHKTLGPSVCQQ